MSELGEDIRRVILVDPMMSKIAAANAKQLQASRGRLRRSQEGPIPMSNHKQPNRLLGLMIVNG
jgi:hypothetical protein